ncbi:Electron transport complex protein RnfE [compost metagenome]
MRNWVPKDIRIPVYVMIIAALVTSVQLLMNAYTYGLYQALGIFIALIVTNCVIIGRAEAYASKNPPLLAAIDGFMMGLGFTLVLLVLGGLREIIGMGTLFDGADLLLGDWAKSLRIELFHADASLLLAILPPGGFIGLGLLIAGKNAINDWMGRKQRADKAHCSLPAAGARTTQL